MKISLPWYSVTFAVLIGMSLMTTNLTQGQSPYKKPPKEVLEILDAPPTPSISLSPKRDRLLLLHGLRYPPIADLAQPMLRLAGLRINPRNNGPHAHPRIVKMEMLTVATGKTKELKLPANPYIGSVRWSPDGGHFALTQYKESSVELWIGDAKTGVIRRVPGVKLNTTYGDPVQWMPDSKSLLCQIIPAGRGNPPNKSAVPKGPRIFESIGKKSPVRTYRDLLKNQHDIELFEFYATSQLAMIDCESKKVTEVGKPSIFRSVEVSPDGKYLLVARNHRPYSFLLPASYFPRQVEVWDRNGKVQHTVASLPLMDQIPIEGVPSGPRYYGWLPTEDATLTWVEALDGGDPEKEVPHRDKLMKHASPFKGSPTQWFKTQERFSGMTWAEDGVVFVRDYDRDRKWRRTFLVDSKHPKKQARLIWDLSIHEKYNNPGSLVMTRLPNGYRIVRQHDGKFFTIGEGATPKGDRPFLNVIEFETLKTKRLFQCADGCYETPVALLKPDDSEFLTRHESLTEPPNYFIHKVGEPNKRALTHFEDSTPQLRKIKKQLVTYKRSDGVDLSFTLYLPPDYKKGQRRPAVLWAYPREYADPSVAGQVSGSPYRFTGISGTSHLFFLTQGYVVLNNATMPVVGTPETVNNTFIKQIVDSAQAAIDKADEMGVIDPKRVGVGGHSYGAFMTANLLAHSDLFKAGVARSGAYNRTLTPFGFQNERRTLWESPETYFKISPFMHAEKINEPILLIHGEVDNNSGTFPMQSDRMYHAIKGNAGTVRYVSLPYESHGYRARESVEHTLYEMIRWFDMYVKNH